MNYIRRITRRQQSTVPVAAPAYVSEAPRNNRSRFRKFTNWFTRKQSRQIEPIQAPPPVQAPAPLNLRRNGIPNETTSQAIKRMMVFFYIKHFPGEAAEFATNTKELPVEKQIRLAREMNDFLKSLPENTNTRNKIERVATDFFYASSLQELDDEIVKEEIGTGNTAKILYANTPNARIAHPMGGSLGRYIAILRSYPRQLDYLGNVNVYYPTIPATTNVISTLKSEMPIDVFRSMDELEDYLSEKALKMQAYIVIKPEFYRNRGHIRIKANKFLLASFIQDAFEQEGVIFIDPHLFSVLSEEAPEFLQRAEIKLSTAENVERVAISGNKFMIFEKDTVPYNRTYIYPGAIPEIQQAMESRKVLLTDPLTMYVLRKDDPALWAACFEDVNMEAYQKLSLIEQLAFCFIQYVEIYKRYRHYLGLQDPPQKALRYAIHLFSIPVERANLVNKYLEEFQNASGLEWDTLRKLTEKVANRSTNINDVEDLQTLFGKMIVRESQFQALPAATTEQMNIEQIQDKLQRIDANLQTLLTARNRATNKERYNENIQELVNARKGLEQTLSLRSMDVQSRRQPRLGTTRRIKKTFQ